MDELMQALSDAIVQATGALGVARYDNSRHNIEADTYLMRLHDSAENHAFTIEQMEAMQAVLLLYEPQIGLHFVSVGRAYPPYKVHQILQSLEDRIRKRRESRRTT